MLFVNFSFSLCNSYPSIYLSIFPKHSISISLSLSDPPLLSIIAKGDFLGKINRIRASKDNDYFLLKIYLI